MLKLTVPVQSPVKNELATVDVTVNPVVVVIKVVPAGLGEVKTIVAGTKIDPPGTGVDPPSSCLIIRLMAPRFSDALAAVPKRFHTPLSKIDILVTFPVLNEFVSTPSANPPSVNWMAPALADALNGPPAIHHDSDASQFW
jgi:hypothetical protein